MNFPNPYEGKHYKKLIVIPLILIVMALFFIPNIPKGVDLKGGSLFTIVTDAPAGTLASKRLELQEVLAKYSSDVSVRTFENPSGRGFEIEVGASGLLDEAEQKIAVLRTDNSEYSRQDINLQNMLGNELDPAKVEAQKKVVEELKTKVLVDGNAIMQLLKSQTVLTDPETAAQTAESEYLDIVSSNRERIIGDIKATVEVKSYSAKEVGSSLSRFFLSETVKIILISLLSAALFVVVIFRGRVASLAVLFGAFADLIITAGVMGMLGIPLSLSTVAALLMLIGFSIDTDMLLTIRGLKRTEGTAKERVYDAMKTAIVMNSSAIVAFTVLVIVAMSLQIETYYQIGIVALIGGLIDFIATWCGNAVMVLWYAEVRQK
ncbi:MAG: hypothetical protein ABIG96_04320 [Candidatus Micrarchaeota archaeon]